MPEETPQSQGPLTASAERLRHELDRWLSVAWEQGEKALDAIRPREGDRSWSPAFDLTETADTVLVDVDLPGIDPQLVDITLAGNMLTLKGVSPAAAEKEGTTLHTVQRHHGPFVRVIPLPVPVNPDNVSAEANLGVLHIRLIKSETARPKKIPVNVAPVSPAPM